PIGIQLASFSNAAGTNLGSFRIGHDLASGKCFTGAMDEIVIYDAALAEVDIATLTRSMTFYPVTAGLSRVITGMISDNDFGSAIIGFSGTTIPSSFTTSRISSTGEWDTSTYPVSTIVPGTERHVEFWSEDAVRYSASMIAQTFTAWDSWIEQFAIRTVEDGDGTNNPATVTMSLVEVTGEKPSLASGVIWSDTCTYAEFTCGRTAALGWFETGINVALLPGHSYAMIYSADEGMLTVGLSDGDGYTDGEAWEYSGDAFVALISDQPTSLDTVAPTFTYNGMSFEEYFESLFAMSDLEFRMDSGTGFDAGATGLVKLKRPGETSYKAWLPIFIDASGYFTFLIDTYATAATFLYPGMVYDAMLVYDPTEFGVPASPYYEPCSFKFQIGVMGAETKLEYVPSDPNMEESIDITSNSPVTQTRFRATGIYSDPISWQFKLSTVYGDEPMAGAVIWLQVGIVPASLQSTSVFHGMGGNVSFVGNSYLTPPFNDGVVRQAIGAPGITQDLLAKPSFYPHGSTGPGGTLDLSWWSSNVWTYAVTDANGIATFSMPDGLPVASAIDLIREFEIDGACNGIDDISFYAKAMWLNSFTFNGMAMGTAPGPLVPEYTVDGDDRAWFEAADLPSVPTGLTTVDITRESSVATGMVVLEKDSIAITGGGREVSPVEISSGQFAIRLGAFEADPLPQGSGTTPEATGGSSTSYQPPRHDQLVYMQLMDANHVSIVPEYYLQGETGPTGAATIMVDKTWTDTGYILPGIYTGVAYTKGDEYYEGSPRHEFTILVKSEYTYNLSTAPVNVALDAVMEESSIAVKASQVDEVICSMAGDNIDPSAIDLPTWESYYPVLVGAVSARNLTYTLEQPDPSLAWMEYQSAIAGVAGSLDFHASLANLPFKGGFIPDTLDEEEFRKGFADLYPESDGVDVEVLVNGVVEWSTSLPMPADASNWEAFAIPMEAYADWRFADLDDDGVIGPDEWVSGQVKIDSNSDGTLDTWVDQPLNISFHVRSVANYTDKEVLFSDIKLLDGDYQGHQEWDWIAEMDVAAGTPVTLGIFDEATGAGGSYAVTDLDGYTSTFSSLLVNTTREGPTYNDIVVKDVTLPLWN
ncbi:MAG: hypothetical protein GYA24_15105, partial [Candidatus Lokiarchaeota archaeon]|nr:hypothetical protein [Candidatus Lokiarchaeota archaeon]